MGGYHHRFDVEPTGCLVFRSTDLPDFERKCMIYPNDELDIGRSTIHAYLGIEDRSVSKHHLRVRCVVYEDDDMHRVAPLIYAQVLSGNPALWIRYGLDEKPGDGVDLGREQGDVLLNPGDTLHLTCKISVDFRTIEGMQSNPPVLDSLRKAETSRFAHRYRLSSRVLGVGGYAAVYVAVKQKTGQQFACKVVSLPVRNDQIPDELRGEQRETEHALRKRRECVYREFNVLKNLSHPGIITMERVIRTSYNVYIFQELITGGDLLSYMDKVGPLPEPQAAMIVRQLLEAVKYLHDNQVVHRDIKPENILMASWREGARVILTDFGQSRTIRDMEKAAKKAGVLRMQSVVGTYGYTAPEVYRQLERDLQDGSGYSQAVDIWSIGCVTGTLLTNEFIFPDGKELRLGSTTLSQFREHLDVLDSAGTWEHIGHRAKTFIRGCLATDEHDRLTASDCLALPWFRHPHYKDEFDAAYKRATQDWQPADRDENIVEFIDTSNIPLPPVDVSNDEEIRSHHFEAASAPQPKLKPSLQSQIGRFRPNELLHASPIQPPANIEHLEDLEQNLHLASQNGIANRAAARGQQPVQNPPQRKKVYR